MARIAGADFFEIVPKEIYTDDETAIKKWLDEVL